jgi:hypothetical protein
MPACPLVPSSPMTGLQTFYITMPSDAAAAMFFDPNLAAVQQQHHHQSLMMQHAAHQAPMSPYRHIQQHHQMIVGGNGPDPGIQHHPFQTAPSAYFMAAAPGPPSSPGGAFFQQQLASPLPYYMRPSAQTMNQTQMMPNKMGTSTTTTTASVPVSAPSPLTVITTSTTASSNASSSPPSSTTNATSSNSNEPATSSASSHTKRLSPIPCTLLEDENMIKPARSVTSKAIATLTGKLTDLLRACKYLSSCFSDECNRFFRHMVIADSRGTNGISFDG